MDVKPKSLLIAACFGLTSMFALADSLTLKADHPEAYEVVKGDTLWDISAKFLDDPWRWPALWGVNPQVSNPHLIYPGDKLTLVFIDGEPRIVKKSFIKSSPQGRVQSKNGPIPPVQLSLIQAYLNKNRVVESDWLLQQPMLLSGESDASYHIKGEVVYVQGEFEKGQQVGIYQPGRQFSKVDEQGDKQDLGQEIIMTSTGIVIETGPINKIELLSDFRGSQAGDRVIGIDEESLLPAYFLPRAADSVTGRVLATNDGIREVGALQVVYLDVGKAQGVEPGHVFSSFRDGKKIVFDRDGKPLQPDERSSYHKLKAKFSDDNALTMPDTYRGDLMVFKTFEQVALALVVKADKTIRVQDKLQTPLSVTEDTYSAKRGE
ncbi:LysM peptidoglycan-binding domain-containing protein [Paraferrimonas haliotis]|uniref:Peptidoglycan-binding protein LysM n=1 Tax=Paraferrimonas haliotis TaxID=2013866 RepID=A0AA37WXY4_9GAMM|nr:LysM peptidoglycan-binding domain-containing protein [Paraferrimonas haliotis]GLS84827.1 peptidoglycan-binding protein LysM [Paraferrimonas haliotis]